MRDVDTQVPGFSTDSTSNVDESIVISVATSEEDTGAATRAASTPLVDEVAQAVVLAMIKNVNPATNRRGKLLLIGWRIPHSRKRNLLRESGTWG